MYPILFFLFAHLLFFLFAHPHFRRSTLLHNDRNQGKHNMFPFYHPFLPVLHAFRRPVLFISCTLCAPFAPRRAPLFMHRSLSLCHPAPAPNPFLRHPKPTLHPSLRHPEPPGRVFSKRARVCEGSPRMGQPPWGLSPRGARHPTHPSRLYRNDGRGRGRQQGVRLPL